MSEVFSPHSRHIQRKKKPPRHYGRGRDNDLIVCACVFFERVRFMRARAHFHVHLLTPGIVGAPSLTDGPNDRLTITGEGRRGTWVGGLPSRPHWGPDS